MNLTLFVKLGEYVPAAEGTLKDKIEAGMTACELDHCDVVRVIFPEGETVDLLTTDGPSWNRQDTVAKLEFYDHGQASQYDHFHPGPDCRYLGSDIWDCGIVDNDTISER